MNLGLLALVLIIPMVGMASAYGSLSKDDAANQYAERERVLNEIKGQPAIKPSSLNVITLEMSKTCKMIQTKSCPVFADLIPYDTTDQKYVGKLTDEKRLKSIFKYPSSIYKNSDKTVICLDCPNDIYKSSRHIILDKPFIYKNNEDDMLNNTRYEYHNRHVDDCFTARIAWNVPGLLEDTIQYLKSGCTETNFTEKQTISKPYSKLSYDGYAYKLMKWYKEAAKLKAVNCLKSAEC